MAKQKIIDETSKTFEIDFNSKNYDYKYTTTENTSVKFTVNAKDNYNASSYYVKDGQNLKIVTVYQETGDQKTPKKTITSTILDYYIHSNEYTGDEITCGTIKLTEANTHTQVSGKTTISSTQQWYAGSDKADTYFLMGGGNTLRDFKGNDTYKLESFNTPNKTNYIYDFAGNDKYTITVAKETTVEGLKYGGTTRATVYDYLGNDTYSSNGKATLEFRDFAGNEKYNINNATSATVYEWAGNDKYEVNNTTEATIHDYAGNDKYTVNNSKVNIEEKNKGNETYNLNYLYEGSGVVDNVGNDKYTIDTANGTNTKKVQVVDQLGNDNYTVSGSKYLDIIEDAGSDKYTVKNSEHIFIADQVGIEKIGDKDSYNFTNVLNSNISDSKGNDTYKLNLSDTVTVTDDNGVDNYTITDSNKMTINDLSSDTKDTYTVKNSLFTTITSESGDDKYNVSNDSVNTIIEDTDGNEKYNIKDSDLIKITDTKGNDTYNLSNVDNLHLYAASNKTSEGTLDFNIKDNDGSDTYTIKESHYVDVYDTTTTTPTDENKPAKDTYNITNSSSIHIYDKAVTSETAEMIESNTYNITNSNSVKITINEDNTAKASADTYNIKSSNVNIIDYDKANDTYKVNKLDNKLTISDGGGRDTLTISSGKAADIIFMADAGTDLGNLFAYDKKNGGFVKIAGYYDYTDEESGSGGGEHEYHLSEYGNGQIETIKIGKSSADVYDAAQMDTYQQAVTEFLTSDDAKGFNTIEKVLNSNDNEVIEALIAKFAPQDLH